ncbi:hypothetical protein [Vibrio cyclitrophicus]|uniref:hypothetical protein n=1 Tax=Vibrio cyclitrophicus TaxID=47951 RepID=UPI0012FFF4B8|nr:hypothetical protein [Vibrio cyclitrophicus]
MEESIKRLWNGCLPEDRFKLIVFLAISLLYCATFVMIFILAYFIFVLVKFGRTQDLDLLHTMKSHVKRLCFGVVIASAVVVVYKGAVTKVKIDKSNLEMQAIAQELETLDREMTILMVERKKKYQNNVEQSSRSDEPINSTEIALEMATFEFEQSQIKSTMVDKMRHVRVMLIDKESYSGSLFYLFRDWIMYAVVISSFTILYYLAFKFLFFYPLLLSDIKRSEV